MLRTTLAGLKLHKARYVTTMLAILLGVMFVSGTMVFADTLNASYEESVMGSATSVDTIATPAEPETTDTAPPEEPALFSEESLEEVRALPEVADAGGHTRGEVVLLDDEGRAYGVIPPAALALDGASRLSAKEGALPSNGGEVALATSIADQTGFTVGDTVTALDPEGQKHDFTVTGLVDFGLDRAYGSAGVVVFDPGTMEEMTGATGYAEIDVLAAEGHAPEQVSEAVAAVFGSEADVRTGEEFGLDMAESVTGSADIFRIVLLLFAFIAMFVAGIVIYNTFAILTAQRQREMALLRCVGAKRGQIFRAVLGESLLVGLVSSLLGVLAGVGIGMAGASFSAPLTGEEISVPVVITPSAVIVSMTVGTVVTVLSALVPAMRATRVPPLTALRTSATATGLEKRTGWFRVAVGLLAFAASAVLLASTLNSDLSETGLIVVTGAALTAFVGVVVLGPLLVRGVVSAAGVLLRRMGVSSMLAVDNSTRNPRRAATTMIALTVGATLITGYSVISASTEASLTQSLDEEFPVDYQISPQFSLAEPEGEGTDDSDGETDGGPEFETIPAEVRTALEEQSALEAVFGRRTASAQTQEGAWLPVTTYSDAEIGEDVDSKLVEGDLAEVGPGRTVVSESYAEGVGVGDTLTVSREDGDKEGEELSLEIVAVVEDMQPLSGMTVVEEDFSALFPEKTEEETLYVLAAEDVEDAEAREAVYAAVDDHPTMQVSSTVEMRNEFNQILDIAFYAVAGMLGLAIIIAVFGISNTMALSVLERTRESALLRALGLARGQLRRMLSVEAVLLCLIGAGIGIGLGVIFGWAAGNSILPNLVFSVPVGQIAVFIALAILAGLLASFLPARKAAATSITGALASE